MEQLGDEQLWDRVAALLHAAARAALVAENH